MSSKDASTVQLIAADSLETMIMLIKLERATKNFNVKRSCHAPSPGIAWYGPRWWRHCIFSKNSRFHDHIGRQPWNRRGRGRRPSGTAAGRTNPVCNRRLACAAVWRHGSLLWLWIRNKNVEIGLVFYQGIVDIITGRLLVGIVAARFQVKTPRRIVFWLIGWIVGRWLAPEGYRVRRLKAQRCYLPWVEASKRSGIIFESVKNHFPSHVQRQRIKRMVLGQSFTALAG
jgi:hypothetical protein